MTSTLVPMIGSLGGMELFIVLAVLVLLFGASKLPELARGSGQALRIFKSETKGLLDSDDDKDAKQAATTAQPVAATPVEPVSQPVSQPVIAETPRERDAQRG